MIFDEDQFPRRHIHVSINGSDNIVIVEKTQHQKPALTQRRLLTKIIMGTVGGLFVAWVMMNQKSAVDAKPIHVTCHTTKGELNLMVIPAWSSFGAERFLQLVEDGFFTNLPLFRCIEGFICQFGSAPPRLNTKIYPTIPDDQPKADLRNFKRGFVSFAGFGPNSRSTHIFITLGGAVKSLGSQPWETPFAYVTEDSILSTVSRFSTAYGETFPRGAGPEPRKIEAADGVEYLRRDFPLLDSFVSCSIKR